MTLAEQASETNVVRWVVRDLAVSMKFCNTHALCSEYILGRIRAMAVAGMRCPMGHVLRTNLIETMTAG